MPIDLRATIADAIAARGLSRCATARRAKIDPEHRLKRFLADRKELTTASLERLMDVLGLTVVLGEYTPAVVPTDTPQSVDSEQSATNF